MAKETKTKKALGRDKEEVRLENPVPDLLKRYGVKVRGDRYQPFCHASRSLSGKVSQNLCYCYVCNQEFDCFKIVGHFEGISDFYDQVKFLGGEEILEDTPERRARKAKVEAIKAEAAARQKREEERNAAIKKETDELWQWRKVLKLCEGKTDEEGFPLAAEIKARQNIDRCEANLDHLMAIVID